MTDETMRLSYRVVAADSTAAVEEAKTQCRAEGYTIRTIAGCRQSSFSEAAWLVTIVVRPKAAA